ncbi:putative squamosa promoter-binding-like protein 19 isoform X2 [Silene latifolia]
MEWDPKSSTWNAMRKLELQLQDNNMFEASISSNNMFSVDLKLGSLEQMGDVPMMDTFKNSTSLTMGSNSTSSSPLSKRGRPRGTGAQTTVYCCVDGCNSDLSHGREYHRRHRVCERHSKTPVVLIGSKEQRFCQQCSRFHSLGEFDDTKRSCRKRLDGHNRRRRKSQPENVYMTTSGCFQTPHSSGSELLQFCCPENWPGNSEPEKALYGSRNHTLSNPESSMWSASCAKSEKQSPYLSGINHQTIFQSSPNDISAARTSTGSLDASFDRATVLSNSQCALSLLSSYPTQSSGMCMGTAIPPLIMSSSSQFPCSKGLEGESSASVSSSSTTTNSYIFGGFHPGQDGFSENRSSRIFPFSLQ